MANWNGGEGFRMQKKRNFVYKSVPQCKVPQTNQPKIERTVPNLQMTNVNSYSSPRKKMRSSYSFYDKTRTDQRAAEELCSDLPLDAFEDDVLDDFTAEELCQVADQAEQQVMTQTQHVTRKDTNLSQDLRKQSIQVNDHGFVEDYFDGLDQDLDTQNESLLAKNESNQTHFPIPSKGSEENANERTAILFFAESQTNNHLTNKHHTFAHGTATVSNQFDHKFAEDIKLLQEKLAETQDRIKELEEQNYMKDGNLKMLQDSLEHFKTEEIKNKEKLRNLEEQKRTELNDFKKNHAKIVEQLNSKICFQDQEIKQAKEQRQARQQHETNSESPRRIKPLKLSSNINVIPMGESFFEQSSAKSPNTRKFTKAQKSPEEIASKKEMPDRNLDKQLMRGEDVSNKLSNVEITQRLFNLPNTELTDIGMKYESSTFNQSLLSLLRLNLNVTPSGLSQINNDIGLRNALVDQELLNSTILDSEFKSPEVCQAIKAIQELINTNEHDITTHYTNLNLVNNFKSSDILDSSKNLNSAVDLLPLLEYHISRYAELRVDKDDDSLLNTCPSSPAGDLSDLRDRDSIAVLSLAFDSAVQSLRCLSVLVCSSSEICEVLLRSVKTWKIEKEEAQDVGNQQV